MDCTTEFIDYKETGYYSSLMMDYLKEDARLFPFYKYSPMQPDFDEIIENRRRRKIDRKLLKEESLALYNGLEYDDKVSRNIQLLAEEKTFTVCTAHQPNLFTGYLYFVYKVLHAIKLSENLKRDYPDLNFVPVYYMGSEDNDLDELGTINLYGKTYRWDTKQLGAVGRMKTKGIKDLITSISEALGNNEYAREIVEILEQAYLGHQDIQTATLYLVNALFGRYGLVVINADRPGFKRAVLPMMREELFEQKSMAIVNKTKDALSKHYHAQANPRDINLFYLKDQLRERIVLEGAQWQVLNTDISFTKEELENELESFPERFSPNVILRGVLQESILPNVAFIGGGGELAYWLELKQLFTHFEIPFPLLKLRHSVLWANEKSIKRLAKIDLKVVDLFRDTEELIKEFVKTNTMQGLTLTKEREDLERFFKKIRGKAENIDETLEASVEAERAKALRSIEKLEEKFLRAEKKKFSWQTDIIRNAKKCLFPHDGLQEREDNILPFYAVYGSDFIDTVYRNLDGENKQFTIIQEERK